MSRLAVALFGLTLGLSGPTFAAERYPVKSPLETHLVEIETAQGETILLDRCGTPGSRRAGAFAPGPADCSGSSLTPDPLFLPGEGYLIDVWVHILQHSNGSGNVPTAEVYEQIGILNEDFRAIPDSLGEAGVDTRLFFRVAGITRTTNNSWYQDAGTYYDSLAVDPARYLNIYTNNAGGNLGYAYVPQDLGADIGESYDRVVIYWRAMGAGNGFDRYDDGRTTTHEVGHYLGLYHTFDGCDTGAGCNGSGDTACDTNDHSSPDFVSPPLCTAPTSSCEDGGATPVENYMNYSDDLCMTEFTSEQMQRIRCTLAHYRTEIGTPVLFYDGFENATTNAWSDAF